jgi:hypothetical protein
MRLLGNNFFQKSTDTRDTGVFHGRRSCYTNPGSLIFSTGVLDNLGFIAAALTGASHFTSLPDIEASRNEAMRTIFLVARNPYIARDVRRAI